MKARLSLSLKMSVKVSFILFEEKQAPDVPGDIN